MKEKRTLHQFNQNLDGYPSRDAPMTDQLYEQRLREDVIYLHSLWHQGPPRPAAGGQAPNFLQPSNTAHFKRVGKPRGRRGRKSTNIPNNETPESKSSPGKEWPSITPSPAEATSSWGSLAAKPVQLPQSPSPEEQLKFAGKKAQIKALKIVREFLKSNGDDADSESGSIDSSSDEDDEFMGGNDGRQEYTFFLQVFMEDAELKDYYEKNFAKGEFSCLICGAVGKNTGKKFKGCLPLVQHSIAVAKTKRRRAHRAYGQAVCKICGWDIDRLSTIVSLLSGNSDGAQVGEQAHDINNVISEDGNYGEVVPVTATFGSGSLPVTDKGIIACDAFNSSTGTDANNTLEGLDIAQSSNVVETVTEGLPSNSLVAGDANNTTEGLGVVDLSNVEVTVAEGSTIGSLMDNHGVGISIANDDGQKEDGTSNGDFRGENICGVDRDGA